MTSNVIPFPQHRVKQPKIKRTLCAMTTPIYCSYISDQPMYYQDEANYDYDELDDLDMCFERIDRTLFRIDKIITFYDFT